MQTRKAYLYVFDTMSDWNIHPFSFQPLSTLLLLDNEFLFAN
ncbi:hypothetical protein ACFCVW_21020 [Bacillus mobilis]